MGLQMFCVHRIAIQRNGAQKDGKGNAPFSWSTLYDKLACRVFDTSAGEVEKWGGRPELRHHSILIPTVSLDIRTSDRTLLLSPAAFVLPGMYRVWNHLGVQQAPDGRPFTVLTVEEYVGDGYPYP